MNQISRAIVFVIAVSALGLAATSQTGCKGYGGDLDSGNQGAGGDEPLKPKDGTAADDD